MARVIPSTSEWLREMRSRPLNSRQKRTRARMERQRQKRVATERAKKIQHDTKMRYTPKERSVYRKALRYGRTLKPGAEPKAVPRVKFNGGRVAVMRDNRGNVKVRVNGATKGVVTELGPRGAKRSMNLTSLWASNGSVSADRAAFRRADKLLSIVGKGAYKHGSTGSSGG